MKPITREWIDKAEADIAFGKTHDLVVLLEQLLPAHPSWVSLRPKAIALTVYAVEFRYPGVSATQEIALQALQDCNDIRLAIRQRLGLTPPSD